VTGRFSYSKGELVRIKVGPFQNFTGRVEQIDDDRGTLKIMVNIFGRSRPVELRFVDVEKISFSEEE
jgi:transcription termination/antitermination protein NusG